MNMIVGFQLNQDKIRFIFLDIAFEEPFLPMENIYFPNQRLYVSKPSLLQIAEIVSEFIQGFELAFNPIFFLCKVNQSLNLI